MFDTVRHLTTGIHYEGPHYTTYLSFGKATEADHGDDHRRESSTTVLTTIRKRHHTPPAGTIRPRFH